VTCHLCKEKQDSRVIYRCNNIRCQTRICEKCIQLQDLKIAINSKRFSSKECPHCLQTCTCKFVVEEENSNKNSLNASSHQNQKCIERDKKIQVILT